MRNPFTTKQTIGVTVATLFVLCCCGGGIVGAVSDAGKPKPAAAPAVSATVEARKLGGVLDATTASPTDTPSPSPTAVTTTSAAAKPTRTPAAKKTTSPPRTTAPKPKPKPTPVKTTAPAVQKGVHPGAFCSPRGALGRTSKGTLMRCGPKGSDTRNRWRAA